MYFKEIFSFCSAHCIVCCPCIRMFSIYGRKATGRKNIELFKIGTPRDELMAEFGAPYISEENDGKQVEMFLFVQGYSKAVKTGRVIFHSVADVMTLGLWEIVGIPTEMVFNGNNMAFHVSYDANDYVDEVNILRKK